MGSSFTSKVRLSGWQTVACANQEQGIAYQLVPHDPLIDTEQCTRDANQMKDLGANAIRVYHVDPNGDHSGCMKAFSDVGIYLFVDLDDFHTDIDPVSSLRIGTQSGLTICVDKHHMEPIPI